MKLATFKVESRDGRLIVVPRTSQNIPTHDICADATGGAGRLGPNMAPKLKHAAMILLVAAKAVR